LKTSMDQRTQQLLTAPAMPLLLSMSAPNSVAFLIQASVSMAEVWFIGRLGSASLAAIALVFPLLMLFQTLSGGAMGGAVASAIARALGAGDLQRAETLIWHALALAAMGAVALLVVFLLAGSEFLRFLGGSGSVLEQALSYSYVLFFGGIFVWLVGVVSAIFRGMGNMRFPAAMMILSAFVQVPLSGLLITGAFGAPKLGVMGAAVSAVISSILLAAVMLIRLAGDSGQIRLTKPAAVFRRHHFADILQVALPASLSPLLTVATIIILTAIVGRFGEQALAGYGIGSRIEFLLIPLVFGIGASMTSLVGVGIGAGDIKRAEHIGTVGGLGAAGLAGGIGLILAVQPELWIPYFSQDPVVQDAATRYIQIVGPWFAFYGLGLVLYFGSQGAGAMGWPVVALSLRAVICVGGSVLLTESFDTGIDGIFYAVALSMVAYGVIMFCALKLGAWRNATLNAQD
jgi:putative MATE family efflux protein